MKIFFLIFSLSLIPVFSYTQDVIKFKTYSFSMKIIDSDGDWGNWSKWEDVSVLAVFKNDRITIYSSKTQEYDITEYVTEYVDSDGDTVIKLKCVDQDGDMCNVRFIFRQNGTIQLYVDFSDVMWVYNMKKL